MQILIVDTAGAMFSVDHKSVESLQQVGEVSTRIEFKSGTHITVRQPFGYVFKQLNDAESVLCGNKYVLPSVLSQ